MDAMMIDCEGEFYLRTEKHIEEGPQDRGVVVYLSSHRRSRSPTLWNGAYDFVDGAHSLLEEECRPASPPVAKVDTELAPIMEPSVWLAVLVALILFASIIGLCWALAAAVKVAIALSFAHF